MLKKNRAVIMDRDGTIFKEAHYLADPEAMEIIDGVIPALKKLRKAGWKLIVGTNQSGIARGYFTRAIVKKIHGKFLSVCRKNHLKIDEIYFCPHHPDDLCNCRKPKPGMLRKAVRDHKLDIRRCVIVGDKKCDIDWGRRAGAKTILVLSGYGREHLPKVKKIVNYVAPSFPRAANWILKNG